ncbi:MAG TPA: GNAT family N-acetyltransferase [Gaiellaceae bacterium]|nr:GNAT family N-acetyltransferase [Gaiellaceae bacterium]
MLLRQWRDDDREPFAALNADPDVMRYFPSPLDRERSDAMVDWASGLIAERGWGLWAVEAPDVAPFIGFVGLNVPRFMPDVVEIGWRLAKEHWGHGYATEAACEALRIGFEEVGLEEIVSFTSVPNVPSRRVMERIGMTHDPSRDFDHPNVPDGPLKRHVFYAIRR